MSVTTPTKQSAFNVEQGMDRSLWIEHQLSVSFDGQSWTLCSRTSPDVSRIISPLAAQKLMSLWKLWVKQIDEVEEMVPSDDDIAEWVGLHHHVNFSAEPDPRKAEWRTRYMEACYQDEDLEFEG